MNALLLFPASHIPGEGGGGRNSSVPPKKTHPFDTNKPSRCPCFLRQVPSPALGLPPRPAPALRATALNIPSPAPCHDPSSMQEPCGVNRPAEAPGPQHCHRAVPASGWEGGRMLGKTTSLASPTQTTCLRAANLGAGQGWGWGWGSLLQLGHLGGTVHHGLGLGAHLRWMAAVASEVGLVGPAHISTLSAWLLCPVRFICRIKFTCRQMEKTGERVESTGNSVCSTSWETQPGRRGTW